MKKVLKFNTQSQNIWFTSDFHGGHNKEFIYKGRGFHSIAEHDAELITRWNKHVQHDDIVINLGDFTLNTTAERTKEIFRSLNGKQIVCFGNHESGVSRIYAEAVREQYGRDDIEVYPLIWENVTFVGEDLNLVVDKQEITCSHFPKEIFRNVQYSAWALSGHCHSNNPKTQPEYPIGKRLDVGIDNFGRPVSFKEVTEIMNKKQIEIADHHK